MVMTQHETTIRHLADHAAPDHYSMWSEDLEVLTSVTEDEIDDFYKRKGEGK